MTRKEIVARRVVNRFTEHMSETDFTDIVSFDDPEAEEYATDVFTVLKEQIYQLLQDSDDYVHEYVIALRAKRK
jgi:hypothetical protein